ncbi:MAG TPA: FapA family protein [Phycisphaerae bacterium]|nr:FapA family protein [Phycisphaerae bacterium]HOJ73319.1 FapA family protein [Phycisphaerae bacterium]HOM51115.1 FapA family protein [Phycisphaerae bacterium]HON66088.1 FapA family protein [Phycisphaerae bacterium]HOQ86073.1 FapA family protein [Phycisphaerae bacterium]
MAAVAQRSIRVAVARDGIRAHLITTDVDPGLITRENIISCLRELGIPVSDDVMARIVEAEKAARAEALPAEPMLLAEGRDPVPGTGATFEFLPELVSQPTSDSTDERADYYRSQILTVEAGQAFGTLTPEVPAVPGVDVYGKPVQPPVPVRSVHLGKNVQLGDDGRRVIACVRGKVHLTRYQVSVLPVVEVDEDVDFSTGNVDATCDVLINGTVRDTFRVKSGGSITVRGAIEAAEVEAATDLQVNGGIASRGQGRIVVGGEVFTKFCNEADIRAKGDITINREALNSRLRTDRRLLIPRGKLIGGRAYARCGAEIFELGNEANVKTIIAVGIDPLALVQAAEAAESIRKKMEAITKIRQTVQPLMAQLKRLSPAQRERATELLYQADAMEQEVREQEKQIAAALEPVTPDGREVTLVVQKIAYPGVSIILGDRIVPLHKERKGPFKVVRRVHQRVEEVLLIDKISGSVTVLGGREYDAKAAQADFGQ